MISKKALFAFVIIMQVTFNLSLYAQNESLLRHFNRCVQSPDRNKLDEKKVKKFIDEGGDVNVKLKNNSRLLLLSVQNEDYELSKYLLENEAKTDWELNDEVYPTNPLWEICKKRHFSRSDKLNYVNLLFKYSANPNPFVEINGEKKYVFFQFFEKYIENIEDCEIMLVLIKNRTSVNDLFGFNELNPISPLEKYLYRQNLLFSNSEITDSLFDLLMTDSNYYRNESTNALQFAIRELEFWRTGGVCDDIFEAWEEIDEIDLLKILDRYLYIYNLEKSRVMYDNQICNDYYKHQFENIVDKMGKDINTYIDLFSKDTIKFGEDQYEKIYTVELWMKEEVIARKGNP